MTGLSRDAALDWAGVSKYSGKLLDDFKQERNI